MSTGLGLDWIRTIANFVEFRVDPGQGKFLTCYCLSVIMLLKVNKYCLAISYLMCVV